MSRYIDADHLIQRAINPYGDCWAATCEGTADFVDYINEEPTAEVKPIVYGKWEIHKAYQGGVEEQWFQCSKCGWKNALPIPRNFCPNCGATMKKVRKKNGI